MRGYKKSQKDDSKYGRRCLIAITHKLTFRDSGEADNSSENAQKCFNTAKYLKVS